MIRLCPILAVLWLVGCSSIARDYKADDKHGWLCIGDPRSAEWRCVPDDQNTGIAVVLPAEVQADEKSSEPATPADAEPVPVTTAQAVVLAEQQLASAPVTQKTAVEETVEKEPLAQSGDMDTGLAAWRNALPSTGYTLQLGAYQRRSLAERAAERTKQPPEQLWIEDILSNGRYLYVLVYGHYPTRLEAQRAAQKLVDGGFVSEFWIRSLRSLREANDAAG